MQKAFDNVNHNNLIIRGIADQKIVTSKPQDTVPRPVLFLIYMNCLLTHGFNANILYFVDDTIIIFYISGLTLNKMQKMT